MRNFSRPIAPIWQGFSASYRSKDRGFTLTEFIVIMLVLAILAAEAIPRMMDSGGISVRTYADQLVAAFQFAQTSAQQLDVATAVNITNSGFSVTQNGSVVQSTSGPYQTTLPNGVGISPTATITFGTNGLPNSSASFTVAGSGSTSSVYVEPTGFTHE